MIKNIVFDFGDVFINLDKTAPERHLNKFGILEFYDELTSVHQDYEKGLISTEEFIEFHTEKFPKLKKTDFVNAWNSILLDFPEYRLEFLKQIKQSNKFNLFLLSNTNDLHIEWVKEHVSFYKDFKSCFDEFYLSFEVNLRKPETDIFQFVLEQNNLKAEETLFIDDTKEHIQSAKKVNLHTWHLQVGKEDVVDLFKQKQFDF